MIVIDASVTMAWSFQDEATPAIEGVLFSVERGGATVPGNWRLEVANSLRTALRLGRITDADRRGTLADLEQLPIVTDTETETRAWHETLSFSDRHGLTPYDAAYLELALRLGVPLATVDRKLITAARAEGVVVLP